ncbi:MAG: sulfurtransferase complex subunit TusD [Kistimonas sp.]|nr:sulfurtransferase complex subunit TusD [Kistimonas sp.]
MNYALVVQGAPVSSQSCQTALTFARTAIKRGHRIQRVFFFRDGVHAGSALAVLPRDEQDLSAQWRDLGREQGIDLVVCVSAALKRGVLDKEQADRYGRSVGNLVQPFVLSGLGQLVDAVVTADRVVTFGN